MCFCICTKSVIRFVYTGHIGSYSIYFIISKTIQNYFFALVSITMTLAIMPVINLFSKYAEQNQAVIQVS
jgi:type VI protein secretion system component VasA